MHSRGGLDLQRITVRPYRPNHGLVRVGLQNRDHAGIATARTHDVERLALTLAPAPAPAPAPARQPRSLHLEELAVEHEMSGEPRVPFHMGEENRAGVIRDEALHARDEPVGGG